ncbi:TPA: hypothetical protein G8R10_004403 [Salmonella enterica]|nr:hypothetical protein [Salmonella enterica subsp. enterica serovar Bispebjerg]EDH1235816.1 hypothetical protein [Salmonella enterica subsp. enterica]HAF9811453.1 hypothetical protein [Salmonella enterica]HCH9280815.1 hypothetical protein [Salmonella enterica]
MSESSLFELVALIKAAKSDPSAIVDAVWSAGYRQPERTAEEAAQITIYTFLYCNSYDMPTEFWPRNYDSVLQNELMKAVGGEDGDLWGADPKTIASSVINAGFSKEATNG